MSDEIWVCADFAIDVNLNLLCLAKKLAADSSAEIAAVCLRSPGNADSLADFGADRIYLLPEDADSLVISECLKELAMQFSPEIILFPSDTGSSVVAARTAALLQTGLTAECRSLYIDADNNLRQIRPAYGGGLTAEICTPVCRPQMATVNTDFIQSEEKTGGAGKKVDFSFGRKVVSRVNIIGQSPIEKKNDIKDAKIIIAGGRGIGSAKGFAMLGELAQKMGAAVGATRSAVDAGFADYANQIGQTGKTVYPELYIALGLSGSEQHIAGMNKSTKVIAVNTDPKARIFDYADIAVVGDWQDYVTALLERLS